MANKTDDRQTVSCSFCGKGQKQVRKMISGPSGVYICDECIELCHDILDDEFEQTAKSVEWGDLPKPAQIKAVLDDYVIEHFRLAFGNRVMKQVKDFVSCFMACGGTEIEAVDFIVAKKVFRKFESLSIGFMKDELTKLSAFLDRTFGKNMMPICKEYIERLKKTQ